VITEHHLAVKRTARYYSVGGSDPATGPPAGEIWIVCHGYGQLAAQFVDSFARFATPSRQIVAPEGLSRFYLDRPATSASPHVRIGAAWMTREDREHEIADQIAYLDALHDVVRPPATARSVRLRVLGFSQSVSTVARWLAHGRARADEVILWAGAFPPELDVESFAVRLEGARVVLVVGTRDELAPWAAADTTLHRFTAAGIDARLVSFDGGHRLDDATLAAIAG
jgi:predicted esterase